MNWILRAIRWLQGFLPTCYCHACGLCTHRAAYRFYRRFHNTCEVCMSCPHSSALWDESWGDGSRGTEHLKMSPWYLTRCFIGNFLLYVGGALILPQDPPLPQKAELEASTK